MKTDSYALRVFVVSVVTTLMVSPANAQSMNGVMAPSDEMNFEKPADISRLRSALRNVNLGELQP